MRGGPALQTRCSWWGGGRVGWRGSLWLPGTGSLTAIFSCICLFSEHVLTVSEVPGSLSSSGAGGWMWTSILPSRNSGHSSKVCVHLPVLPRWRRKKKKGRKFSDYVQVPGVCRPLTFTVSFNPHDNSRRKNTAHDLHMRNLGLREVKGSAQSHTTVSVSCNWNPDLLESKSWAPLRPPRWRLERRLVFTGWTGQVWTCEWQVITGCVVQGPATWDWPYWREGVLGNQTPSCMCSWPKPYREHPSKALWAVPWPLKLSLWGHSGSKLWGLPFYYTGAPRAAQKPQSPTHSLWSLSPAFKALSNVAPNSWGSFLTSSTSQHTHPTLQQPRDLHTGIRNIKPSILIQGRLRETHDKESTC